MGINPASTLECSSVPSASFSQLPRAILRNFYLLGVLLVAVLPALAQPAAVALRTPADQVIAAVLDVLTLPPEVQVCVRYLDLSNMREHVGRTKRVLDGHMQHLSSEPDREKTYVVPNTNGMLLRINLKDYGISADTWELLEKVDAYFHVQKFDPKLRKGEFYPANWLAPTKEHVAAVIDLQKLCYTHVPIVNGSWFANQTMAQENRNPGFYDFRNLKSLEDFDKQIGFDAKKAEVFGDEIRASIGVSGVSRQPRGVDRKAAAAGGRWRTLDFKLAAGEANPIRNLNKESLEKQADAFEYYGVQANRFFLTYLDDKNRKRQDFAPSFVGKDYLSKSKDPNIHINVSCYRCHKNSGLQGLRDWTRNVLSWPQVGQFWPNNKFRSYDEYREFRKEHLRPLEPLLAEDRLRYETAVLEVTGWTAAEYAENYAWLWEWTEDAEVDLARAAADMCVPPAKLKAAFLACGIPPLGGLDPALAGLVAPEERAEKLGYRQWLEMLPIAHDVYRRFTK